ININRRPLVLAGIELRGVDNKTKTAAQLGITFRALRYKLKKLGME
ncbi:hypothetical protein J7386_09530, partial [Xanthomonas phaseoli pv. dieffenbachiae]